MANEPYYAQGDYRATIISHTFQKGQYGIQLLIGIEPHVEADAFARTIYMPLLDLDGNPDKNSDRTIAALKSIGYADSPSRLDAASDNPATLIGNDIDVQCKYTKDGKERWYIKSTSEPVDKSTLRKLDALFGKELKKGAPSTAPAKAPTPTPSHSAPAPKSIDDANAELAQEAATDDIPF